MKRIIIIFILIFIYSWIVFKMGQNFESSHHNVSVNDTIKVVVEEIINKNDSILKINDSINIKVIEIEKTYEKTVDDIIRNNPYDDYNFFSTYIERYCGRNNSDTTQDCESYIR